MSLTLDLSPELEAAIRKAAEQAGMAPETFAATTLQERVGLEAQVGTGDTESSLLEQINAGLPVATWQRYQGLIAKRRSDAISDAEYSELLRLTEDVELWNARRGVLRRMRKACSTQSLGSPSALRAHHNRCHRLASRPSGTARLSPASPLPTSPS